MFVCVCVGGGVANVHDYTTQFNYLTELSILMIFRRAHDKFTVQNQCQRRFLPYAPPLFNSKFDNVVLMVLTGQECLPFKIWLKVKMTSVGTWHERERHRNFCASRKGLPVAENKAFKYILSSYCVALFYFDFKYAIFLD